MKSAPKPPNEAARLEALHHARLLDTPPELAFDEIVRLASFITGAPMALITLVDADRQWFKAKLNIEGTETSRDVAFCAHAILGTETFVVPDAVNDERFSDNPLVTASPNIRFYAGAPLITQDGYALGTLCVLDKVPRKLSQALEALRNAVRAQIELREHTLELRRLQGLKDDLVAMILHDLRNPLSAVSGFLDLATEYAGTSDTAAMIDCLQRAHESAGYLKETLEGLLTVRLIEHGELRPKLEKTWLSEIVKQALQTMEPIAKAKEVALELSAARDYELELDRNLARRALENLLTNAIKYTREGTTVTVSLAQMEAYVAVDVSDRGPGIPAELKSTLFQKFGSIEAQKGEERSGFGLGLFLVKLVADLHRGLASAHDREGGGTTFRLLFPAGAQ